MAFKDLTDAMNDACLLKLGEDVLIGSDTVRGIFRKGPRVVETPDGEIVGLDLSLDCKYEGAVIGLTRGDIIVIANANYRFERFIPAGGDESGWVIAELGTIV